MQCPRCEGITRKERRQPTTGREFTRETGHTESISTFPYCPHCDGTGEIEQGHAWVGTLRTFTCIAVYSERGWMILCGEKMIIEEEFKPTNRMKMVK